MVVLSRVASEIWQLASWCSWQ